MASVIFSKKELRQLVGSRLRESDIEGILPSLGVPVEWVQGDEVCVDVTPNRPDLLSVEGIARLLSSFLGIKRKSYAAVSSSVQLRIDPSVLSIRPCIVGALVRDVQITGSLIQSLMQLQEKIHETFGRRRRKVSIGVHNFDAVQPPFHYKAVEPRSCSFIPLDMGEKLNLTQILEKHPKGIEYGWILAGFARYPILVDSRDQVLSFPPIINGELTRVTERTRNIFIDVTGTDENAVMDALKIISLSLVDRGGKLFTVEVVGKRKFRTPDLSEKTMELQREKINRMLGMNFSDKEMKKLLGRMGYADEGTRIRIPCYRVDVMGWVDIAEDVAIAYGYNNFEPTLPNFFTAGKEKRSEVLEGRLKEVMLGLGFLQTICQNLTNEKDCFERMLCQEVPHVKIKNPKVAEYTMMRTWLSPSLLRVISESKQAELPIKIFEIGDVVALEGNSIREGRALCCALYDSKATFSVIKSIAEAVIREMGWEVGMRRGEHPSFIKGRIAELVRNNKRIGFLGEVHPQVLNNFGLEQPTAVLEVELTSFF